MTIYALSTGPGISGIAVIRISGKETSKVVKLVTGKKVTMIQEFWMEHSGILRLFPTLLKLFQEARMHTQKTLMNSLRQLTD